MRRSVKNTLRAGALCLVLLACALFTTALAAEGEVTYVKYSWDDDSGLSSETLTQSKYTLVENSTTTWKAGWYVVEDNVNIGSRVQVNGNVNLILTDGSSLNISGGIRLTGSGNSLTIYGQEEGTGRLTATAYSGNAGIGGNCGKFLAGQRLDSESGGAVNIHGGVVIATGGSAQEGMSEKGGGAGIGGAGASSSSVGSGGAVTIYGGTVAATGQAFAAGIGGGGSLGGSASYVGGGAGGNVKIYGGTITSNGNGGAVGIGSGTERSGTSASHGTLTIKGDAFVVTNSIGDADGTSEWEGVVFNGANGQIYGGNEATVSTDAEVPAGYTLTIGDGQTLTVAHGATLAVKGTLINNGTVSGDVTFPEMGTGTGTDADPYKISTAEQLRALASIVDNGYNFSGKTVVLDEDIDLGGEWNPIGEYNGYANNNTSFCGTFDGNGHIISGMTITNSTEYCGLFARIGTDGKVENLGVQGSITSSQNCGGIAAANMGTILNCYSNVDITARSVYAGGIVYLNTDGGRIENCYNIGDITARRAGGIFYEISGTKEGTALTNCYNYGNLSGDTKVCGITAGTNHSDKITVTNCYYLNTTATTDEGNSTALTAAEFAQQSTFTSFRWDFINTWVMSTELGRPVLRSVPEGSEFLIDYVNEKATGLTVYEISTDQRFWYSGASELEVTPGGTLYVRNVYDQTNVTTVRLPARPAAPALAINSATQSVTVDIGLEYSFDQTKWTSGMGEAVPVGAGDTIYVRYKASQEDGKFSSEIQALTAPGGAPAPGTPAIDYTGETVGTEAGMQYSLSETGPWTACTADMPAASFGWDGTAPVTVYFRADPGAGYPGEPVALTIPARPAAPAVEGATGRIAGADKSMEYSAGGENWTRFTDETLARMEPGEYQVRYAATESSFRSEAVPVTVAPGGQGVNVPETYGIELIVGEGGEAMTSLTNASAGTKITVTATPDEGYELAYITVDGERISGASFTMPDHDVTVRVYFTGGALPFEDTPEGAWYYDAVSYVYANGLMDGVSATQFAPDANMTRAMLVTILWRMEGEPVVNYLLPFTDVDGGAWYAEAVRWAASEGIVTGVSAIEFAPNAEITREQLAAILHRYAGEPATAANLDAFTDAASVSAYAVDAMSWCVEQGIITGTTATTLDPQGTATRAQCAAMLMRFMER